MEARPVIIACIENPLKPLESRTFQTAEPGITVFEAIERFFPMAPPDMDVTISLNGVVFSPGEYSARQLVLSAGDNLAFCVTPHGGGGDGKNPLATLATLALIAVSVWVPGAIGLTAGTWGAAVVSAGVMMVGGLLINSLFPPPSIDNGGPLGGIGDTPTYSWAVTPNATAEGSVKPVLYGKHRVCPPLIGKYVETQGNLQYLNLLYLVADHALKSITDVEINDTAVGNYKGVEVETRLGDLDQSAIQFFGDTKSDVGVGVPLTTDWVTRETQGNGVKGLAFGIGCPQGFGYIADDGSIASQTAIIHIEYRLKGTDEWIRATIPNLVPVTVEVNGRWSGGYWGYEYHEYGGARKWFEFDAGSENKSDHVAGERYFSDHFGVYDAVDPTGQWGYGRMTLEWRWVADEIVYQPGDLLCDYIAITDATRNAVHRIAYKDNLPIDGTYEMRVRLASPLETGPRYMTAVYWEYYQEIVYEDFCFPGVSLLAVRALATDQLSGGLPRVTCLADRGNVPVETGAGIEYLPSNNPAWACYDVLHDVDYGGAVPSARLHYSAFEEWAEYCESEGFQVNVYLDSEATLRRCLDVISILGRGAVVQMGTKFTAYYDGPNAYNGLNFDFGMGSIIKDSFSEEFLAMDDRADAVEITYFDQDMKYTRQSVVVESDTYQTTDRPTNKTSITLIGETRRDYAARYGRFILNQNRYITLTASWTANVQALGCLPGDVVQVSHDVPQWGYSGRLVSATAGQIILDRPVILAPGHTYAVSVRLSETDARTEAVIMAPAVETETATLTLSGAWSHGTPGAADTYLFGRNGRVAKLMRILKITRATDQRRKVQAIEYVPEVYADKAHIPAPINQSDLAAVVGLAVHEIWVAGPDGSGRSALDVTWRGHALAWQVYLKEPGGTWVYQGEAYKPQYLITAPLAVGKTYNLAVVRGTAPDNSAPVTVTIQGKAAPPSDVTGFRAWQSGNQVLFSWNHIPDGDRWGYEIRQGGSWATGQAVVNLEQKDTAEWRPPLSGTYKFWIKAIDDSGVKSVNAATAILTATVSDNLNIVLNADEIPTGAAFGTFDNMVYLPAPEMIAWLPGLTDADLAGFNDLDAPVTTYAGDWAAGLYTTQVYDLGAVVGFSLRMAGGIEATAGDVTDRTYPSRTDRTYPLDTDIEITSLSTFRREYRISDNGADWSEWIEWTATVDVIGRYYQGRFVPVLDGNGGTFAFTAALAALDVPDKKVERFNQTIGVPNPLSGTMFTLAGLGVTILQEYHVAPTVLGTGAAYAVVDKAADQFTVRLFNAAGTAVAGAVDLRLRGF